MSSKTSRVIIQRKQMKICHPFLYPTTTMMALAALAFLLFVPVVLIEGAQDNGNDIGQCY